MRFLAANLSLFPPKLDDFIGHSKDKNRENHCELLSRAKQLRNVSIKFRANLFSSPFLLAYDSNSKSAETEEKKKMLINLMKKKHNVI